jgi:hypothetical protein
LIDRPVRGSIRRVAFERNLATDRGVNFGQTKHEFKRFLALRGAAVDLEVEQVEHDATLALNSDRERKLA